LHFALHTASRKPCKGADHAPQSQKLIRRVQPQNAAILRLPGLVGRSRFNFDCAMPP
jgi:hypothetical protein